MISNTSLADAGLADRVLIETNVSLEDKAHLLRDVRAQWPATYGESFGLYVLEANACGVPVVEPITWTGRGCRSRWGYLV